MYLVEQDLLLRTPFLNCCEINSSARRARSSDVGWALGVHGECLCSCMWCFSLVRFNTLVSRSCLTASIKMIRLKVLKGSKGLGSSACAFGYANHRASLWEVFWPVPCRALHEDINPTRYKWHVWTGFIPSHALPLSGLAHSVGGDTGWQHKML